MIVEVGITVRVAAMIKSLHLVGVASMVFVFLVNSKQTALMIMMLPLRLVLTVLIRMKIPQMIHLIVVPLVFLYYQ